MEAGCDGGGLWWRPGLQTQGGLQSTRELQCRAFRPCEPGRNAQCPVCGLQLYVDSSKF